jgi:hypothetical protein
VIEMAKDAVSLHALDTDSERAIEQADLLEAIEQTAPSAIDWMKTARNLVEFERVPALLEPLLMALAPAASRIVRCERSPTPVDAPLKRVGARGTVSRNLPGPEGRSATLTYELEGAPTR